MYSYFPRRSCQFSSPEWGGTRSLIFQGFRYAVMKDLERSRPSRKITLIFAPLSGLGQDQAFEINEKARRDVAIFYDKTKRCRQVSTGDRYCVTGLTIGYLSAQRKLYIRRGSISLL